MNPIPLEEDLGIAYEEYFTHDGAEISQGGASKLLLSLLGMQKQRRQIEDYMLNDLPPGRVLELGFGDGRRLRKLTQLGWDTEGQEVDPVSAANAQRNGHKVHLGPLETLQLPAESYDAIVSSHVIEHVPDPSNLLRECNRLLKPGGRLVMVTPNAEGFGHRLFGRNWIAVDAPRHLYLFSSENLAALAVTAGLGDVKTLTTSAHAPIQHHASMEIRAHGHYDHRKKIAKPQLLAVATLMVIARIGQLLGLSSGKELILIAERPST